MNDLRVKFPKPCSENWNEMAPSGCNRHCEVCDKTIHDLSQLTLNEAEQLLGSGKEICARANVGATGIVALKANANGVTRRMVAAVGTSIGLLATASAAAAADRPREGMIAGKITGGCGFGYVTAIAADGREYVAKIGMNGRYKIKHLPDGHYDVFLPDEGEGGRKQIGSMIVQGNKSLLNAESPDMCIVVGQVVIEADHRDT